MNEMDILDPKNHDGADGVRLNHLISAARKYDAIGIEAHLPAVREFEKKTGRKLTVCPEETRNDLCDEYGKIGNWIRTMTTSRGREWIGPRAIVLTHHQPVEVTVRAFRNEKFAAYNYKIREFETKKVIGTMHEWWTDNYPLINVPIDSPIVTITKRRLNGGFVSLHYPLTTVIFLLRGP